MVIPRKPDLFQNEGIRRDYTSAPKISPAYLLGVLHDATKGKTTYRIASKSKDFCLLLKQGIKNLNTSAWVYKEGKNRNVWITEFSQSLLKGTRIICRKDKIHYIRGYFDAEGGIARSSSVRYYIYFSQKDFKDLMQVKMYLQELKISCGKIHNPSREVDPDYWRFYISANSHLDFANIIGSFHPQKSKFLRMKR